VVEPYNAGERKSVRAAEKVARLAERERHEVIVALMAHAAGRRYVWDRLSAANIFTATFSTDALQMAFAEGNRNQGLQLLSDVMQACPDQFILAMREANERSIRTDPDTAAGATDDLADTA
jgi:hypothetical protein